MKKIIFCIIALILTGNIFAQKVSGGLFFGPTMSWMGTDSKTITTDGMKLGYNFGALIDMNLIDNFAISTGIQFNKLGGNINFVHGAYNVTPDEGSAYDTLVAGSVINYSLNYLAIPFGFKGKTNEIGYLTYFLKAGVTPLINIKTLGTIGSDENILLSDEIKLFNMGWHIGGGVEYSLSGNTRILFEVLYNGGLFDVDNTEVFSTAALDTKSNPKVTLSDIHLKVGILF
ncbi:MAG TPA: porin family protein [Bacteroidales bacterium]|nr:porin family protein [Bacteroidales bacterium]